MSLPLTRDDFIQLDSQREGGCVLSVHDSCLADSWLNDNYELECLENLRMKGIGGPVASMLSINVPALTIFGPMSQGIIKIAEELARISGFPVMIRPATEDPSAYFE